MKTLFQKINERAQHYPQQTALVSGEHIITNRQLLASIEELSLQLKATKLTCLALYMDNSIEWIIADLAAMQLGITLIPIPLFLVSNNASTSLTMPAFRRYSRKPHSAINLTFLGNKPCRTCSC